MWLGLSPGFIAMGHPPPDRTIALRSDGLVHSDALMEPGLGPLRARQRSEGSTIAGADRLAAASCPHQAFRHEAGGPAADSKRERIAADDAIEG